MYIKNTTLAQGQVRNKNLWLKEHRLYTGYLPLCQSPWPWNEAVSEIDQGEQKGRLCVQNWGRGLPSFWMF